MQVHQNDYVEKVREATDIVQIVTESVGEVKQKNNKIWACCPFHNEKTPSFTVDPERQVFYCFGCKEKGDVFAFLQKVSGADFKETLDQLAKRAGIEVQRKSSKSAERDEYLKKMFSSMKAISQWYSENLLHPEIGKQARIWLDRRGISAETVQRFGIGWAPNDLQGLDKLLEIDEKVLLDVGFLARSEEKNQTYPSLRNRIMIPIRDHLGRPIAFSGRVTQDKAKSAKYINTRTTTLFSKQSVLYGLDQFRSLASQGAVVVEGYTDVMALNQAGRANAVAVMGTAFTSLHARALLRKSTSVTLAFDGDVAGKKALFRSLCSLVPLYNPQRSLEIKVLPLSPGMDPDSVIQSKGVDAWDTLMAKAINWEEYLVSLYQNLEALRHKSKLIEQIKSDIIAPIESSTYKDLVIQMLAQKLKLQEASLVPVTKKRYNSNYPEQPHHSAPSSRAAQPSEPLERHSAPAAGVMTDEMIDQYANALPADPKAETVTRSNAGLDNQQANLSKKLASKISSKVEIEGMAKSLHGLLHLADAKNANSFPGNFEKFFHEDEPVIQLFIWLLQHIHEPDLIQGFQKEFDYSEDKAVRRILDMTKLLDDPKSAIEDGGFRLRDDKQKLQTAYATLYGLQKLLCSTPSQIVDLIGFMQKQLMLFPGQELQSKHYKKLVRKASRF